MERKRMGFGFVTATLVAVAIMTSPGCKKEDMVFDLKGTQWKVSDMQQELYIDFTRGNKIVTWIRPDGYDCFLPAGGTNLRFEQTADSLKFEIRNPDNGQISTVRLSYQAGDDKVTFIDASSNLKYVVKKTAVANQFSFFDPVRKGDVELMKIDLKDKSFKVCEMTWEEYVKEKMKSLLEKQGSPKK